MLKLIKLDEQYKPQLTDMMDEWTATGETIIPYAIRKCDYHDFPSYLASLEVTQPADGLVPDSTYFCLDTERSIFVGAVNIRHYLSRRTASQRRAHRRRHSPQRARQGLGHAHDCLGFRQVPAS